MNQSGDLYAGLHHVSLLVSDIEQSARFYIEDLGMQVASGRPQMPFRGLWLQIGAQQIHLLELAMSALEHGMESPARDAHCALAVTDINVVKEKLSLLAIPYQLSKSGRKALFCRDPDGNGLEFVEVQDDSI